MTADLTPSQEAVMHRFGIHAPERRALTYRGAVIDAVQRENDIDLQDWPVLRGWVERRVAAVDDAGLEAIERQVVAEVSGRLRVLEGEARERMGVLRADVDRVSTVELAQVEATIAALGSAIDITEGYVY